MSVEKFPSAGNLFPSLEGNVFHLTPLSHISRRIIQDVATFSLASNIVLPFFVRIGIEKLRN